MPVDASRARTERARRPSARPVPLRPPPGIATDAAPRPDGEVGFGSDTVTSDHRTATGRAG